MPNLLSSVKIRSLLLLSGLLMGGASPALGLEPFKSQEPLTISVSDAQISAVPAEDAILDEAIAALEQAAHAQINQYRAQRGLPALTLNTEISAQARSHSQAIATGTTPFGHNGLEQRLQWIAQQFPWMSAAENVAYNMGHSDPVVQAVTAWLNSAGHQTNIVGDFDQTGIGIARNEAGGYYFTQIFIRSR